MLLFFSARHVMTCLHMRRFTRRQQQAGQPLSGKVALITGATTGIGLATADYLTGAAARAWGTLPGFNVQVQASWVWYSIRCSWHWRVLVSWCSWSTNGHACCPDPTWQLHVLSASL
jgi:hypothetical protein